MVVSEGFLLSVAPFFFGSMPMWQVLPFHWHVLQDWFRTCQTELVCITTADKGTDIGESLFTCMKQLGQIVSTNFETTFPGHEVQSIVDFHIHGPESTSANKNKSKSNFIVPDGVITYDNGQVVYEE